MIFQNVKIINHFKRKPWIIVFALLFFLFAYTRFWNLEGRTIFGWDQERDAFQIYNLLVNKKIFLIGPRVLSDNGFFLGPYYSYLLSAFYAVTRLDPFAIVLFIIIFQSTFFFFFSFILSKTFSKKIAFLALFLYTVNPLMIKYDIIAWNPIFIPTMTVVLYGIWWVIYHIKKINWLLILLLGVVNGLAFHFHVQGLFLLCQTVFFLSLFYKKSKQTLLSIGFIILGFILTFLPVVLFDIRHDFLNFKMILNIFNNGNGEFSKNVFSFVPVLFNFINWQGISILPNAWITFFVYMISLFLILYIAKKQEGFIKYFNISYAVLMLIVIIGFMIYGKRPSEYYFNVLVVGGLVIISQVLISLDNRVKGNWFARIMILGVFLFMMIKNYSSLFQSDEIQGLQIKKKVVAYSLKKTGLCDVVLHKDIVLGFDTGFSYMMRIKKPPINGLDNQCKRIVRITFPAKEGDTIIGKYGVKVINIE